MKVTFAIYRAMAHDVISTCPVCSNELAITRLHCASCGTTLEGDFSVGRFGRLNRDQLALLESFLRSRGNLREMERELGISYPTVRARVEALVRALGFGPRADAGADDGSDDDTAVTPVTRRPATRSWSAWRATRSAQSTRPSRSATSGRTAMTTDRGQRPLQHALGRGRRGRPARCTTATSASAASTATWRRSARPTGGRSTVSYRGRRAQPASDRARPRRPRHRVPWLRSTERAADAPARHRSLVPAGATVIVEGRQRRHRRPRASTATSAIDRPLATSSSPASAAR